MKTFQGKTAVITGAASGIGRALAHRSAQAGMRVVLADIEAPALERAAAELRESGADVLAVRADVSQYDEVENLTRRALEAYGAVHLLCNNAGVSAGTNAWESTLNDWAWVIGVNLWGVLHGVKAFLPAMLEGGQEGHIVNTASVAGLLSYSPTAAYHLTKHAVVALSEKMYYDLALRSAQIGVSVLCPGLVSTRIMDCERVRPARFQNDPAGFEITPEIQAALEAYRAAIAAGMAPEEVADRTFVGIQNEQFYILTHPETNPLIEARLAAILNGEAPVDLRMYFPPSSETGNGR